MNLDKDRLRAKLQDISKSVARLKILRMMDRDSFLADEDSQDIARSRLLIAIEAALNICYHLTAKKLQQVPDDYAQCFGILGTSGLIPQDLADRLALMARFRNRLVHLYWQVDYDQVYTIFKNNLVDLEEFTREVARHL